MIGHGFPPSATSAAGISLYSSEIVFKMKPKILSLFIIGYLCLASGASGAQKNQAALHTFNIRNASELKELLSYVEVRVPLILRHRGGALKLFPENCIATFENTLRSTHALLEVDPRYTKDGAIVLMHDATLDRTTTGAGNVADHTLAELKALRLKDPEGNITDYRIDRKSTRLNSSHLGISYAV